MSEHEQGERAQPGVQGAAQQGAYGAPGQAMPSAEAMGSGPMAGQAQAPGQVSPPAMAAMQQGGQAGQRPGQQPGMAAPQGQSAAHPYGHLPATGVQGYGDVVAGGGYAQQGVPMMGTAPSGYMEGAQMPGAPMQGGQPGMTYASPQMAQPQMATAAYPQYAPHYPPQHVPQYAPEYAHQYAPVAPAAMGVGSQQPPAGAPGASGGQAGRGQAGIASLMEEISSGGTGLNSLTQLLNLDDTEFWKGALVGAAAVVLFTNESVQSALFKTGARTSEAVRGGVDKLKTAASDAAGAAKE